jgi:hypothetical protein
MSHNNMQHTTNIIGHLPPVSLACPVRSLSGRRGGEVGLDWNSPQTMVRVVV